MYSPIFRASNVKEFLFDSALGMISQFRFLRTQFKRLVERILHVTIYRTLPRGIDPFYDLERLIPNWKPLTIFDVGANVGQSAKVYAQRFPFSAILSFEPGVEAFRQLERCVSAFRNVRCIQLAFAAEAGTSQLIYGDDSSMNRIAPDRLDEELSDAGHSERVVRETVDGFCERHGIQRIDYLKIDTEGADLDVLRGAERMLRNAMIGVIEVEVGIGQDNETHVPLGDVRHYLESLDFLVFGFYEQVSEWKRHLPHLRRANAIFVGKGLGESERSDFSVVAPLPIRANH